MNNVDDYNNVYHRIVVVLLAALNEQIAGYNKNMASVVWKLVFLLLSAATVSFAFYVIDITSADTIYYFSETSINDNVNIDKIL